MPVIRECERSLPVEVVATPEEREVAQEGSRKMATFMTQTNKRIKLVLESDPGVSIEIPDIVANAVFEILRELSRGNAVCLMPRRAELTTQEAAEILNVSRPYLMSLVKAHKIVARKVGNRNRILYEDLMRYKRAEDEARQKIIYKMIELAQEAGDDD